MKPTLFNLQLNTRKENGQTVAELDIDGVIGFDFWASEEEQNTKEQMRAQLKQIQSIQADKIVVNISSLGGDVDHGLAIHDLLASNAAQVHTHIIGMTASAATIIAQAGDVRTMSDNALYLIHKAWTIGMGNANDFEALTRDLNKLDERISNIYAKRSAKSQDEFLSLMNESNGDGIWITASEAKDFGLIDDVSEPMKAAALDRSVFAKYGLPFPEEFEEKQSPVNEAPCVIKAEDVKLTIQKEVIDNDSEELEEESVSAASRERAKLQILKLKQKNNG